MIEILYKLFQKIEREETSNLSIEKHYTQLFLKHTYRKNPPEVLANQIQTYMRGIISTSRTSLSYL